MSLLTDPLQLFSFAGALMILIAYGGHQLGKMNSRGIAYNVLNAIGSGILGYVALKPFKLGFVVLELSWVAISIWAMFRNSGDSESNREQASH